MVTNRKLLHTYDTLGVAVEEEIVPYSLRPVRRQVVFDEAVAATLVFYHTLLPRSTMPSNKMPVKEVIYTATQNHRLGTSNTLQFLIISMLFVQSIIKLAARFASQSMPVALVSLWCHYANSFLTGSLFLWLIVKCLMRYRTFWYLLEGWNVLVKLARKRMSLLWNAIIASLLARRNNNVAEESIATTTSNQSCQATGTNLGSVPLPFASQNQDVRTTPHVDADEAVAVQRMERAEPVAPSLRDSKKA